MEIQTQLELKDFKALMAFNQRRLGLAVNSKDSWVFVVLGVTLGGLLALGGPGGLFPFHWPSAGISFVIAFLMVFVTSFRMIRRLQDRLLPTANSPLLGPHLYRITPEGVWDISPRLETRLSWSSVSSFQETSRHFFLMIDDVSGYVLPKRFLPEHEGSNQLRQTVLTYMHSQTHS